jgi:DNA-3-methyladenine glycosylase II
LNEPIVHQGNLHALCDSVALRDEELKSILTIYGYPPLWKRTADFVTLVHVVLEQQVSLASAQAALNKLKAKTGEVTPENLLRLSDAELRACYFSRQKTLYARDLAQALVSKKLDLADLEKMDDESIRKKLKEIKGIGDWTVDIYLLMAMGRSDIFPSGDLALIKSLKKIKKLSS